MEKLRPLFAKARLAVDPLVRKVSPLITQTTTKVAPLVKRQWAATKRFRHSNPRLFLVVAFSVANFFLNLAFGPPNAGLVQFVGATLLPLGAFEGLVNFALPLGVGFLLVTAAVLAYLSLGEKRSGQKFATVDFRTAAIHFPTAGFEQQQLANFIATARSLGGGVIGNVGIQLLMVSMTNAILAYRDKSLTSVALNPLFLGAIALVSVLKIEALRSSGIATVVAFVTFVSMSYFSQLQIFAAIVCLHRALNPETLASPNNAGLVDVQRVRNALFSAIATFLLDGWGLAGSLLGTTASLASGDLQLSLGAASVVGFVLKLVIVAFFFHLLCQGASSLRKGLLRLLRSSRGIMQHLQHWSVPVILYICATAAMTLVTDLYGDALGRWLVSSVVVSAGDAAAAAPASNGSLDVTAVVGYVLYIGLPLLSTAVFCLAVVYVSQMFGLIGVVGGKAAIFEIDVDENIISDEPHALVFDKPRLPEGGKPNELFALFQRFKTLFGTFLDFMEDGLVQGDRVSWRFAGPESDQDAEWIKGEITRVNNGSAAAVDGGGDDASSNADTVVSFDIRERFAASDDMVRTDENVPMSRIRAPGLHARRARTLVHNIIRTVRPPRRRHFLSDPGEADDDDDEQDLGQQNHIYSGHATIKVGSRSKTKVLVIEPMAIIVSCKDHAQVVHNVVTCRIFFNKDQPDLPLTIGREGGKSARKNHTIFFELEYDPAYVQEEISQIVAEFRRVWTRATNGNNGVVANMLNIASVFQQLRTELMTSLRTAFARKLAANPVDVHAALVVERPRDPVVAKIVDLLVPDQRLSFLMVKRNAYRFVSDASGANEDVRQLVRSLWRKGPFEKYEETCNVDADTFEDVTLDYYLIHDDQKLTPELLETFVVAVDTSVSRQLQAAFIKRIVRREDVLQGNDDLSSAASAETNLDELDDLDDLDDEYNAVMRDDVTRAELEEFNSLLKPKLTLRITESILVRVRQHPSYKEFLRRVVSKLATSSANGFLRTLLNGGEPESGGGPGSGETQKPEDLPTAPALEREPSLVLKPAVAIVDDVDDDDDTSPALQENCLTAADDQSQSAASGVESGGSAEATGSVDGDAGDAATLALQGQEAMQRNESGDASVTAPSSSLDNEGTKDYTAQTNTTSQTDSHRDVSPVVSMEVRAEGGHVAGNLAQPATVELLTPSTVVATAEETNSSDDVVEAKSLEDETPEDELLGHDWEKLDLKEAESSQFVAESSEAEAEADNEGGAEDIAAEKEEAERIAAEKAEAERVAAAKAEAERIAAEKAEAERAAAAKAEAERIAAAKAEAERIAAEKAEAERVAAAQAEAERIAAEKAEAERAAAAKAEAERIAAEKAEAERIAAEKAEAERIAAEKAEAERIAAEKAEAERIAAEKAEAERIAAEKAEAERIAAEKAEAERIAAEKAEAERIAAEKAEAERVAAAKAEAERVAAAQAEAERIAAEKAEAERVEAERKRHDAMEAVLQPVVLHDNRVLSGEGNAIVQTLAANSSAGRAEVVAAAAAAAAEAQTADFDEELSFLPPEIREALRKGEDGAAVALFQEHQAATGGAEGDHGGAK